MADGVDAQLELLEVARHADGPAVVAEVALELSEDGGDGKARERESAPGVEALDRLEEAERGDLLEIVGVGAAVIAASEVVGEGKKAGDECVACRRIMIAAIAREEPGGIVLRGPLRRARGCARHAVSPLGTSAAAASAGEG